MYVLSKFSTYLKLSKNSSNQMVNKNEVESQMSLQLIFKPGDSQ